MKYRVDASAEICFCYLHAYKTQTYEQRPLALSKCKAL